VCVEKAKLGRRCGESSKRLKVRRVARESEARSPRLPTPHQAKLDHHVSVSKSPYGASSTTRPDGISACRALVKVRLPANVDLS
jgi:hypothetical protein